jgi:hypothetical protein
MTGSTSPPEVTTGSELKISGQPVRAGDANHLNIIITDPAALQTLQRSYGKPSATAKLLLVLPAGFDPAQKAWPILIVSSTTDGAASSIGSARSNYQPDVTNKGYVLLAVDGEFGRPEKEDSTEFRWALVSSALAVLAQEWPQSKSWPFVPAGISGGGGYASHQAMMLIQKQAPVIGLFLAVSKWTPASFPDVMRRTPIDKLHNLPIFISAGDKDKTATPQITASAHQSVVREGFRKVRFERFDGGHQIHRPHLQAALDWFLEQSSQTSQIRR